MTQNAIDLGRTPIHLSSVGASDSGAEVLLNFNFDGPSFETYIKTHCSAQSPGRIIMIESSAKDWDSWECHPLGDEIVIVLEGEGTFIQATDQGEVHIPVSAGMSVVNPKGVWHTADITVPIKAVYITPAPDTHHKPRD